MEDLFEVGSEAIGRDLDQGMDREIAADNARADAMGLIFDSDPRVTQKTGAIQASPVSGVGETPGLGSMPT